MSEDKSAVDSLTGAKSLPMNEKLKILDREIRRLHRACADAGYKPEKIREVASPVLKTARRGQIKKISRIGLYLILAVVVCYGLTKIETTKYAMSVAYRKTLVYGVLPFYDWTGINLNECIIDNPYYDPEEVQLSQDNCTICQNVTTIQRFVNADPDEIAEMIFNMVPAVISDAMSDWRAITEGATLDTFIKMYATDERTMNVTGEKQTNHFRTITELAEDVKNVTAFAKRVHSESLVGNYPNFTAQWSNIAKGSFKALHYYYIKPYFLPSMCEAIRTFSYIMVARQPKTKKLQGLIMRPRMGDMGIWVAQVSGQFEIILNPEKICENICPKVRFVLKQGEILNVPTGLYQITYRPNSTEGVGIGVGYEFQ